MFGNFTVVLGEWQFETSLRELSIESWLSSNLGQADQIVDVAKFNLL